MALQHETANLDKVCKVEAQQIDKLEKLVSIIDELNSSSENGTLTLSRAAACFKRLQVNF